MAFILISKPKLSDGRKLDVIGSLLCDSPILHAEALDPNEPRSVLETYDKSQAEQQVQASAHPFVLLVWILFGICIDTSRSVYMGLCLKDTQVHSQSMLLLICVMTLVSSFTMVYFQEGNFDSVFSM